MAFPPQTLPPVIHMDPAGTSPPDDWNEPITRHNRCVETLFSGFNGVYMGMALFAAPIVAVTGVRASPLELTILVAAFPVGAFLGPLWATLGRRLGMKQLVVQMAIWANLPLLFMFWVESSVGFTILIAISQLLNSAMRMGQSSLYRIVYAQSMRGRVLGQFTFWTYITMVPTVLVTGWLLDKSHEMYRVLYPLGGLCGLIGCFFYHQLHVPEAQNAAPRKRSFRSSLHGVERIIARDRSFLYFQISFFLSGSSFFMSTHVVLLLVNETFAFSAFELALWMSVVPQALLALGSPIWGRILDRIGIIHCRLVISIIMTVYLGSYWLGVVGGVAPLIFLGSILQGMSNAGGQLTWYLASSHFAPSAEEVPFYNGIHFVLNGVRGVVLPWIGSILFVTIGPLSVLVATLVSLASIPFVARALNFDRIDAEREGRRPADSLMRSATAASDPTPVALSEKTAR